MQKLIDLVKPKSNYQDFVSIFDAEAKFKPTKPPEAQRTQYFKQNLAEIMKKYLAYLIKNQIQGITDQNDFVNKIQNNQIESGDLVMNFAIWLDTEDAIFTFEFKKPVQAPRPVPPPPQPMVNQTPSQPIAQSQQPNLAQKTYQKPPLPENRSFQIDSKRDHSINTSGPYNFSKIQHRPQPPTLISAQRPQHFQNVLPSQIHKSTPNAPTHTSETKKNYAHQNISHHQITPMQHYTPNLPDQSKPFRNRFYEKLADFFEYPERAANIKQDLALMFQQKKG